MKICVAYWRMHSNGVPYMAKSTCSRWYLLPVVRQPVNEQAGRHGGRGDARGRTPAPCPPRRRPLHFTASGCASSSGAEDGSAGTEAV